MTGANSPLARQLQIVAPAEESPSLAAVGTALEAAGASSGWNVLPPIRTVSVAYRGLPKTGRKRLVLSAEDTQAVYQAAHRAPLAVLASAGFYVRQDPRSDPIDERALWLPADFLRHKAYVSVVRSRAEVPSALQAAGTALSSLSCDGQADPRILPMHIFSPDGHKYALDSTRGQRAFKAQHGSASSRRDAENRVWTHGPNHAGPPLVVAGATLPAGFHWDVKVLRGSSEFSNGWEVWQLIDKNSYVNIAPNATVRNGARCSKRWPA